MNPKYCLANLQDENSANSQENFFNPFDFQHILNNGNDDPDINFLNNKFDVVVHHTFLWKKYLAR